MAKWLSGCRWDVGCSEGVGNVGSLTNGCVRVCACRGGRGIVAKRLSGCHWDVGRSEGVMNAEEESGEFMERS